MLNCKLTSKENDELARLVKEANVGKSTLIRKVLQITFKRANDARKRVKKQTEVQTKSRIWQKPC